jgi:hypothetical protein
MSIVFLMCCGEEKESGLLTPTGVSTVIKQAQKINNLKLDQEFLVFFSDMLISENTAWLVTSYVKAADSPWHNEHLIDYSPPQIDLFLQYANEYVSEFHVIGVAEISTLNPFMPEVDWKPGLIWSKETGLIEPD